MTDPADLAQTVRRAISNGAMLDEHDVTPWSEAHAALDELVRRLDQAERERDEYGPLFVRDACRLLGVDASIPYRMDALIARLSEVARAERENAKLLECVDLLRPEEADRFWHLYRTHPALASHAAPAPEGDA